LQWLLHPLMAAVFRWETRKRLAALRGWFGFQQTASTAIV
jgi:hypothetical protein